MNRLIFTAAALVIVTGAAFAQTVAPTTIVTVPYGEWFAMAQSAILTVVIAGLGWAFRQVPGHIVSWVKMMGVEQILARAVDHSLNAVAGASRDKALSFDVGNAVVAHALAYVVRSMPSWFMAFVGGQHLLVSKIQARLNLADDAKITAAGSIEQVTSHDKTVAKAVPPPVAAVIVAKSPSQ